MSRRCSILDFRLPQEFCKGFSLKMLSQRTACQQAVESADTVFRLPQHPARVEAA